VADLPRPEYPRPELVRERWLNLNGPWELALDDADRGLRDGFETRRPFPGRIVVPFPLEAELSGVADRAPHPVIWYRREVELPAEHAGGRLALRIGACDHATRVFVNGREVGSARGGYAPIGCEVAHAVRPGRNELVLRVEDRDTWSQPRGKQIAGPVATGIDYDRVTGVWQTVWLEPLPEVAVCDVWTSWSPAAGELAVRVGFDALFDGEVRAALCDAEGEVARAEGAGFGRPEARLALRVPRPRAWSPASPQLYQLRVELARGGRTLDAVRCPVGLREIRCDGRRLLLNGEPLYLRGVLDQGYYPGGWYTAPDDGAFRRDLESVRALGLNAVRKHQKAEDPRFLHWADRLGVLVFAEMPSGRDFTDRLVADLVAEWSALVRRDRAHPSVIGWVPFNESWGVWHQAGRPRERAFVEGVAALTRALDGTRPVIGNDGWEFSAGDVWGLHSYAETGEALAAHVRALLADPASPVLPDGQPLGLRRGALPGADVSRLPVLLSECGGVGYVAPGSAPPERPLFVYGDLPASPAAFEARLRDLARGIDACDELSGFVWTQLTDVQQERNGLFDFERKPKLPPATLREIFGAIGARAAGQP
jgi:beta-galactosidase/beta-glucuronidase